MPERLTVAACERFVTAATKTCAASARDVAVAAPGPDFDALAVALAQQNNLIAGVALLIGVVALFAGLGWGFLVKLWAENSAREAAREWMERNAGDIISQLGPFLQGPPPAPGVGSPLTPHQQAEELENEGENPAE